jgi:DNA-directed RNA polymerase subunit alpha
MRATRHRSVAPIGDEPGRDPETLKMIASLESIAQKIRTGDHDAARKALESARASAETTSELRFLRGYLKELSYDREGAAAEYESLLQKDADHSEAAFRLALLCDQAGDEERALELYETCTEHPPMHVNAALNLALLYEEEGRLTDAEHLVRDVLDEYPNHARAEELLKSILSSQSMAYDERNLRDRDSRDAVLDVPITDFELSVRSRNCLRQMNIRTLNDLLRTTEPELLSYKNFGETSLNEIKAMLTQKGFSLGHAVQPVEPPQPLRQHSLLRFSGDAASAMRKPISELELSVRSRKCLQRLGVTTLGELTVRSEAELLAIKNFGQTSLTEIKRQLALHGISLRESAL